MTPKKSALLGHEMDSARVNEKIFRTSARKVVACVSGRRQMHFMKWRQEST
jgi:hypothetical protein